MAADREAALRVAANLENLRVIRRFVDRQATRHGLSGGRLDDLILAVDEAATNIIVHGYEDDAERASAVIEVQIVFHDPILSVILRDRAAPFDPTAAPVVDVLPPLAEREPGGLGVFLIRKLVDDFRYRRSADGWNELTLEMSVRSAHPS